MPYVDHFNSTDGLIAHLDTVIPGIADPVLKAQYVGFLSVAVVTVFELCVKDLLIDFARRKNRHFGIYCANVFDRLNGRVALKDLKETHIKKFGEKYVSRFEAKIDASELAALRDRGISLKSSYGNVIIWRHKFAHEGVLPANANYMETTKGYEAGKEIVRCLAESMVR